MFEKLKKALAKNKETARWVTTHGAVFALSFHFFPAWCEKKAIPSYKPEGYLRFGEEFGWLPLAGLLLDKIDPEGSNPCWLRFGKEVRAALREIIAQAPFAAHPLVRSLIAELKTGRKSPTPSSEPGPETDNGVAALRPQIEAWFVKELGLDPNSVGAEGRKLQESLNNVPTIGIPIFAIDTITKIYEARVLLLQKLGRAPSNEELVEASGATLKAVEQWVPWITTSGNKEMIKRNIQNRNAGN